MFPFPPASGGQQATFSMINYLRNYLEITLVCPGADKDDLSALKKKWPNVVIEVGTNPNSIDEEEINRKLLKKIISFAGRVKYYLKRSIEKQQWENPLEKCNNIRKSNMRLYKNNFVYNHEHFINKFHELIQRNNFDIIQIEFAELLGLVHFIPEGCKKVFVHHEISYVVMDREIRTLENRKAYEYYLLEQAKTVELSLLRLYDRVIVLSEMDKAILCSNEVQPGKLSVSPFAVKVHSVINNSNQNSSFKNKIIFLGNESHNPNLDAVYWFVKEVLSGILKEMPEMKFYVTGLWRKEVTRLFRDFPSVIFTGYIENMDEILDGAAIVVPIRIGSGTRTKIIDAVLWKVPVITTSIGVEGIPLEDGKDCLVADDPDEFVQKLKKLNNQQYYNSLTNNAIKKLGERANVDECGEIRMKIYERLYSHVIH